MTPFGHKDAPASVPQAAQPEAPPAQPESLAQFQAQAARFHSVISIPDFETSPEELAASVKTAIAQAEAGLARIGGLTPAQVNFTNTVRALDDVNYVIAKTDNRLSVIKETSTNAAMREAATDQVKIIEQWSVGLDYREDVYRAVKAYAETQPNLQDEDAKLLTDTMRDYRRAGMDLPKDKSDEVEALRKKLSALAIEFESNVTKAESRLVFTKAEMEGVPEDFLDQPDIKSTDGTYTVMANITTHYVVVMDNAKNEQTRLKMQTARDSLAKEKNIPLLQQILVLRDTIALKLGYDTWADYVIEIKMAKTAARATDFLERLSTGLQPKFDAEVAQFRALKAKDTGDPNAQIYLWDCRYYANQLKKEKYTVDEDALKVYFPYQRCLDGMFAIYQRIFGLKFLRLDPPYHGWTICSSTPCPMPPRANRWGFSILTCFRARANTTTSPTSASSTANCLRTETTNAQSSRSSAISPHRRPTGPLFCRIRTWSRFSTNSATPCTPF